MKLNSSVFRTMMLTALLFTGMAVQARVISGTVKDATGETIISASVVVKGTTLGTVTDFDGNYTLDVPDDAKVLIFSYIGMQTQELNITGDVLNVVLSENSEVLEEVVVTGYGTTKKRDLVTAVSSVSAEQLKDIPVASASEALQGKLAGVTVTTTEGSADADVKIRVRGGSSLTQSSDPLYIVDGFPVSSISDIAPSDIASMDVLKGAAATAIYGAQGANGVIIITTKDIDATDDKMEFHVDYSGYVGWKRMAKKYDMMDNREFVLMQYEYNYLTQNVSKKLANTFYQYFDPNIARDAQGKVISGATPTPIADILDYWNNQPHDDWQRKTFGPTWGEKMESDDHQGFNSNHSFSVSGGNKNAQFSLSYNRIDDKGIMYGSDYSRNNIAFKSKFKPFKNFTVSVSARYSNTNILGAGSNTADDSGSKTESRVRNAVAYTPLALFAKDADQLEDYDSFGSLYDPITTIDHNYKKKRDDKWRIEGYASYKFLKKFTLRADIGYEGRYRDTDRFYGATTYYSREGEGYTNAGGVKNLGHVIVTDERDSKLRNVNSFTYEDKWGQHSFKWALFNEQQWNKSSQDIMYGYGYDKTYTGENVFDRLNDCVNKSYKNKIGATDNMLSFFTRVDYNYAGRYLVMATFRADCSTRFAKGNQWGYFPAVGAAWRISDEPWMEGAASWLSNLKLRFDYGMVGNNNVETGYLFFDYATSDESYMNGFSGTMISDGGADKIAANPNLKWETTITRDLGIDFGFFNERLTGVIDLYWNNTKDLIIKYRTSLGGYNYQYRNIGSTRNRGIEVSLKGVALDKRSKSLSYGLTIDANISFNENTVTDLGGMTQYPIGTGCFKSNYKNTDMEFMAIPGQPMGAIYGYISDGWYTAEDFDKVTISSTSGIEWTKDGSTVESFKGETVRPGSMKYKDLDGNKVIDENDRTVIGNTLPLFTGGFSLSAHIGGDAWGDIDLGANFSFSYGNDVLNLSALDYSTIVEKTKLRNLTTNVMFGQHYSLFDENGNFIPESFGNGKTITGTDYDQMAAALAEANAGAVVANPVCGNFAMTDKVVEDGSYLRLNSLTIGYSFPTRWISKAKMTKARIFFQATNVFCATKYSGADPEVDTRSKNNPLAMGVDFSAYPKSRGFNIGANVSF